MPTTIETSSTEQRTQKSNHKSRRRQVESSERHFVGGDRPILYPRDRRFPVTEETIRFRPSQLPAKTNRAPLYRHLSLENCFTIFGVVVAVSLITLCTLDLVIAWPWMRVSRLFDVTFLACGWMLIAMCYETLRDQAATNRWT